MCIRDRCKHCAATWGLHSRTEPVSALSLYIVWLVRAFHDCSCGTDSIQIGQCTRSIRGSETAQLSRYRALVKNQKWMIVFVQGDPVFDISRMPLVRALLTVLKNKKNLFLEPEPPLLLASANVGIAGKFSK